MQERDSGYKSAGLSKVIYVHTMEKQSIEGVKAMKKKKKPIVLSELKPEELKKYEIAKELGLLDRVLADGWQSLSAKETGKIGGMLSRQAKKGI
jgi:hypothetical protein